MNKDKIIKDLEYWIKNFDGKVTDFKTLCEAALLIKELAEENERLHASCAELTRKCASLNDKCASLNEENEKLKNICESYMLQYGTVVDKNVLLKPLGNDLKRKI
jgi:cell shape-determining protein MreC